MKPCLNGNEVNNHPTHKASRYCIDLNSLTKNEAKQYPLLWEIIEKEVRPYRQRKRDDGTYVGEKRSAINYWIHRRPTYQMYEKIKNYSRVMVMALTSNAVMPVWVQSGQIYSHALAVFALKDDCSFGVLSSSAPLVVDSNQRLEFRSLGQDIRLKMCLKHFQCAKPPLKLR